MIKVTSKTEVELIYKLEIQRVGCAKNFKLYEGETLVYEFNELDSETLVYEFNELDSEKAAPIQVVFHIVEKLRNAAGI